jgi:putative ABC transport system permease protein
MSRPGWIRVLGRLLPERYRTEILDDLIDERGDQLAQGRSRFASGLWLASHLVRSAAASRRSGALVSPAQDDRPFRFGGFWQDLRYAARILGKQPVFGAAVVLTLALGIGANSAIFALVDATLLRGLSLPDADRLVAIWERTPTSPRANVSAPNLYDWKTRSHTFEDMALFTPNVGGMVMSGIGDAAETVSRQWVSAGVFDVLGITAIAGRTFTADDVRARVAVVVLSEAFWRTRFNADPSVVGRAIRFDGTSHTVVGIVGQEAQMIGRASMWALAWNRYPEVPAPELRGSRSSRAVGRLKPGVTIAAARSDLAAIAADLAREFPDTNAGRGITLERLDEAVIGRELRQTSLLFLGVVGLVLLICCANVANLLLTRAMGRRRELALRSALGADRFRIVRQLLTEALLLSAIGGGVGLCLGAAILRIAPSIVPADLLPAGVTLAFDMRIAAFCALTALLVGLLFGLAPAMQATQLSSARVIGADGRTTTARRGRLRAALVMGQVATAVVLLVGAGLLLRTVVNLEMVDRGYHAESALTMIVDPPGWPPDALLRFYGDVERAALARPGVRSVAWASTVPLGRSYQGLTAFEMVGDPVTDGRPRPTADYQVVSPAYFETLDLPVVAGRRFDQRDTQQSALVCMVNEAFVRKYLRGRSPIGSRVAITVNASPATLSTIREIVGVARQVKGRPDESEDLLQIYVPLAQEIVGDIFMIVRPTSGSASVLSSSIRSAFAEVDKGQVVSVRTEMTLDDVAAQTTARYRFRAILVMTFAALALALAMIGVFGVLAYAVEQQVREIGVRRAVGATTADVLRLVVGSAAAMIGTGAAAGLAMSIALGRLVASMLFGVEPLDALTFAAATLVLAATAVVSVAGPAWRVTRIDPLRALRTG